MPSEQPPDDLYGTIDTARSAQWMKHPTKESYILSFGTVTVTFPREGKPIQATMREIENADGMWMGKCTFTEDEKPKEKRIPLAILKELNPSLPPTPNLVDDPEMTAILGTIRKRLGLK